MDQRSRITEHTAPTAPVPMPGRLPVSYYDRKLRMNFDVALDETKTDSTVTATGTITTVRYLDTTTLGRTMIVLTADNGENALVSLSPDVVGFCEPVLRVHARVTLHGLTARHEGQPVSIEGLGVRVAND
ncbi:hypothetical protein [Streptomyces sp. NBC_01238]|uniref:hypothetical protein n=1 Tax=Streptomyces sp. NBC_01238 TaxID=2903791 RepID=UPI002F909057